MSAERSIAKQRWDGQRWLRLTAVLVSAALLAAAFPPFDRGELAWVALAPALWAFGSARSRWGAFLAGYAFGIVHWLAIMPWLGGTVSNWAGSQVGWLAWITLALIEGLWFAVYAWLARHLTRRWTGAPRALTLAGAWVVFEWLRILGSLAIPWALVGYTQHRFLWLIQIADAAGVWAVSLLLLLCNAALAERLTGAATPRFRDQLKPYLPAVILLGVALAYGPAEAWLARRSGAMAGNSAPYTVAVMQTGIGSVPMRPRDLMADLRGYRTMADDLDCKPDLVVWPESASPADPTDDPAPLATFGAIAQTKGAQLFGAGIHDARGRQSNSAVLALESGTIAGRYDKEWLVPYGEFIPGRWWISPFKGAFNLYDDDVVAGSNQAPLAVSRARVGAMICFESIFPQVARARAADGANLLTLITNDSWAGPSAAPAQHAAMTVFRAVETRRPIAVASTTGISGLVQADGGFRRLPPDRAASGCYRVRLMAIRSLYVRFGDWLPMVCAALALLGLVMKPRRGRRTGR